MNSKIIDSLLLILYCGFIYWLSSHETLPAPMWFNFQDKLYHAAAYGLMALLAWRSFRHLLTNNIILALSSVVFSSLYGVSDEWHQYHVPGRSSDVYDWVADTIGAIISVYLISRFNAKMAVTPHALAKANCASDCVNCSFQDQHSDSSLNSKR